MRRVLAVGGVSLAVLLASCGGDDDKPAASSTSTSTTSTSSTTVTSTTTTTLPCTFSGATAPVQNALASEVQYLTSVTAAPDGCVDVLTFKFRGSAAVAPSYQISYEPGPFLDTAGREVRPAGTAFLKIRFEPAWIADLSQENAPLTYTGPKVITPADTSLVRGLALFDASEGMVGWVAGIDGQRPFAVEASVGQVVVTVGP